MVVYNSHLLFSKYESERAFNFDGNMLRYKWRKGKNMKGGHRDAGE